MVAVERRGKYLVLRLESGLALLVHLRMTGGFGLEPATHERAVLELDDGTRLAYRDVRRFGTWLVLEDAELDPYLSGKNGPEPLGPHFTAAWLAERLSKRRAALKAVLLDQRVVAGLGNIYADEALWRARLNPLRSADSLTSDEVRRLVRAIRAGASRRHRAPGLDAERPTRQPDGSPGSDAGGVPRVRPRRRAVPALPARRSRRRGSAAAARGSAHAASRCHDVRGAARARPARRRRPRARADRVASERRRRHRRVGLGRAARRAGRRRRGVPGAAQDAARVAESRSSCSR